MSIMQKLEFVPLLSIPEHCFSAQNSDDLMLRQLRMTAKRHDGFFLIRQGAALGMDELSFLVSGEPSVKGLWLLGKITNASTGDNLIFEVHVRRRNSCYYTALMSKEDLEENLGIWMEDGDRDLCENLNTPDRSAEKNILIWDIVDNVDPFADFGFRPYELSKEGLHDFLDVGMM